MYDTVIIGAGPAGMSAAVYGMRAGLNLLLIEKNPVAGGQIINTYEVDNYLGLPGINGFDMATQFKEHVDKLGAETVTADVTSLTRVSEGDSHTAPVFKVSTSAGDYETKTVILATGASHALLNVPGETQLSGRGVSYCATCDGAFFRNRVTCVVGGGDVAVEDAIFLSRFCEKVYLIHRRDELRAVKALQDELFANDKIEVLWDSIVTEIKGTEAVEYATVENVKTGETRKLETAAVFVAVGIVPDTGLAKDLVSINNGGYIEADESCQTSMPGIYVAGDARAKRLRQIATAVADGANAITSIGDFLNTHK